MKNNYLLQKIGLAVFAIGTVLSMQNCADQNLGSSMMFSVKYGSGNALVYGDSEQDQKFLKEKLDRYSPPAISDIFNNWKMISGKSIYNSITQVPMTGHTNQHCLTSKDAKGNWVTGTMTDPSGKVVSINPNVHTSCVNGDTSTWFAALSWSFFPNTDGGYLYNATNSDNFNGFVSNIQSEIYTHEVKLSASGDNDDDEISVIIAMHKDELGNIHTLSASRTHGGYVGQDLVDKKVYHTWYLIYKMNNTTKLIIPGQAPSPGKNRWLNDYAIVRIVRNGSIIKATTSDYNQPTQDAASLIEVDISTHPLLSRFAGPQHYGYAIRSQPKATFANIKFEIPGMQGTLYDLKTGNVWRLDESSNRYVLDTKANAFKELGYPMKIGNPETQNKFVLYAINQWELLND